MDTVPHKMAFRYPTLLAQGANMIKHTIVHDVNGTLTTLGHGGVYLLPKEPFLVEGVSYNTALDADGVWQVDFADADYANLLVEPVVGDYGLGWVRVYHQYPPPASGAVTQLVRTVLGSDNPVGTQSDQFPLTVALDKEYSIQFLDESKLVTSTPPGVDIVVRFAEREGHFALVGVPWTGTIFSVTDKSGTPFTPYGDINSLRNARDNGFFIDNPNGAVVVKIFSTLPSGAADLIATGTENYCVIR